MRHDISCDCPICEARSLGYEKFLATVFAILTLAGMWHIAHSLWTLTR